MKKIFFIKKSKKERLIKKTESTFKSEMDIINILLKIHEINNLKMILFDDDQLLLFNHLSKHIVTVPDNEENNDDPIQISVGHLMAQQIQDSKNFSCFADSYKHVLNNEKESLINKKLIY